MKVAVIGVGTMGRHHARVYSELPEADLVAISDSEVWDSLLYRSSRHAGKGKT
jgi:glyceraldehyde-3-phosphate dehydrogenase/erythrose-4-phosphate dehydrogenase